MPNKAELRLLARQRRAMLFDDAFGRNLAHHAAALKVVPGMIVGGYHAHQDEADPALLLSALVQAGARIAFPRVRAKDTALDFHLVPEGEVLSAGCYGVHEPKGCWPSVVPALLLVPLLAYDDQGYRLGYGGGYYDRTLAALGRVRTIGVGYSGQRTEALPHDLHDHPLHAILTEQGLKEFHDEDSVSG